RPSELCPRTRLRGASLHSQRLLDAPLVSNVRGPAMNPRTIAIRLSVMMFLEYAVRGMWYPYRANSLEAPRIKNGLGFTSGQTGWVMGFAPAVGAITAPFIAGQVADRYFNAERALATLHVITAILLF